MYDDVDIPGPRIHLFTYLRVVWYGQLEMLLCSFELIKSKTLLFTGVTEESCTQIPSYNFLAKMHK